jgi:MoaA/NifB/PqqE/SkfB family radical SAM enzyme
MHYHKLSEIRKLSLDHTSKCNLACPQCARTNNNLLPIDELTLDDYRAIILPIVDTLEGILYCGNFGDAVASNTLLPALTWLYNESEFKGSVNIFTNGSLRDTSWWTELGELIGKRGSVSFSIDGLADTNHIYRVNSNFKKIIDNATAYINAGGIANWDYLVFKHNEEQIEEAKSFAKSLGFKNFKIKQTNRFMENVYSPDVEQGIKALETSVDPRAKKHKLEITSKEKYQGTVKSNFSNIIDKHGSWTNYANSCNITCKTKIEGRIFVDFEARVWACTWTAGGIYYTDTHDPQRIDTEKIFNKYGKNFNSLRHHSLEEILNHEYYADKLCSSWTKTREDEIPKLETCVRFCGSELDTSTGWIASAAETKNKNTEVIKL